MIQSTAIMLDLALLNKDHEVNDNKGDRETDVTEDETFKILMYDDVPLTSDTSEWTNAAKNAILIFAK